MRISAKLASPRRQERKPSTRRTVSDSGFRVRRCCKEKSRLHMILGMAVHAFCSTYRPELDLVLCRGACEGIEPCLWRVPGVLLPPNPLKPDIRVYTLKIGHPSMSLRSDLLLKPSFPCSQHLDSRINNDEQ
jgi:hypothetical protein